ncbi:DUF6894 family protein [Sphingopyxis sp. JAI128]|uniref:DUF6894 family protein n=1 Tax=Sphingopyxis sp. JAI128 TaxID=2723066 RepID=UPI00161DC8ED|nr:hypothetical protein [Sphingopyxis sp. JAI128]MBB6427795.1 hypothetical protein [Sphingopyxis sp. JAI128]
MGRYFFHTRDGHKEIDEVGVDLLDDAAARLEAVRYCGSLLADDPHILRHGQLLRVECVDDAGRLLYTLLVTSVDANGNLATLASGAE